MSALLEANGGMSDRVAFNELSAKTIVLCAASYFEREVGRMLVAVARQTGSKDVFCKFIDKQALERRFHTMFDWKRNNANAFFGLFGSDVKEKFAGLVKGDDTIGEAIKEFMFLNDQRNQLVHGNFAGTQAVITFEEGYAKFNKALAFLNWLPDRLRDAAQDEVVG
jgi:hypothetical protein